MNFKEALKDTSICKWLFGSDLDSTLKTAKELEKSTQQLKVPKKVSVSLRETKNVHLCPGREHGRVGNNFVLPTAIRRIISRPNIPSVKLESRTGSATGGIIDNSRVCR
ncbi:unnamed protein product [Callosobruchus maculatus]|uniref:Uncharacterized protein n=1 Tax=Callosobruchus maculatus TaxID=64391 RepID=A0A653BME1_CALMS|nr:unnamed protein product [Callosobruchus maculatus]